MKKLVDYELLCGIDAIALENTIKKHIITNEYSNYKGYELYGSPFYGKEKDGRKFFYQAIAKFENVNDDNVI